jgi:hypothetical protein
MLSCLTAGFNAPGAIVLLGTSVAAAQADERIMAAKAARPWRLEPSVWRITWRRPACRSLFVTLASHAFDHVASLCERVSVLPYPEVRGSVDVEIGGVYKNCDGVGSRPSNRIAARAAE